MDIKDHVSNTLKSLVENHRERRYLLAVSAGVDSMALAHIFLELGLEIEIAHCDFQLRTASEEDKVHILDWCKKHKIRCHVKEFNTLIYAEAHQISTQMAARDLRYHWFGKLLSSENLEYIVTAHHLDDHIETFFIKLLRRSGLHGLTGIPENNRHIIRPMLSITKEHIITYAERHHISWREDISNSEEKYLRNKIRLRLLPVLEDLFPSYRNDILANMDFLRSDYELLRTLVQEEKSRILTSQEGKLFLTKSRLTNKEKNARLLAMILHDYGFTPNQATQIMDSIEHVGAIFYSASHELLVDRSHLILRKKTPSTESVTPYVLDDLTKIVTIPQGTLSFSLNTTHPDKKTCISLSQNKLNWPLKVRYWKHGDSFYPRGMNGKRQKLKKYFVSQKLDRFSKTRIPLLVDREDEIIWVIGYRADERFKGKDIQVIWTPYRATDEN